MSKFLQSQPNLNAVLDGSLALYGASIGAGNLAPGFTVKTDASRHLYSTTLAIGDTTGLQGNLTSLANKTQNITESKTSVGVTSILGSIVDASVLEALGLRMVQVGITPPPTANRGLLYSDTSNQLHYTTVGGGDVIVSSSGLYLPLAGGTMSGAIAMGTNNITNIGTISGATNTSIVDNLITNAGKATSGRVATFSSDKIIQDGGTLLSDLATNASLATYLPLAGGTMSGNINLGGFAIGGGATTTANGVCFGNMANCGGGASVAVGNSANASGLGATAIGYSSICSTNNSLAIGINANNSAVGGIALGRSAINSGVDAISIGTGANCSTGSGICIGPNSVASAPSAIALGLSANNATAGSFLVNSSVNIRSGYTTCDLGTTTLPFQNLYLNSGIESTAGLVIGPASATSIAIGRATITSTVNGIFVTPLAQGAWYSNTTYNPSFAAAVNRLTPPAAATAGTLVDFTHSLGVLTYTGARTRQFRIAYNITFTSGGANSNMTFFNSISASTTTTITQAQQKQQIFVQNSNTQMAINLLDIITLTNGQSVQLAGACATLSAIVGYNLISCTISAMPN